MDSPVEFVGTLFPHQVESLEWTLEKEDGGTILCLEMGLGKTIITIATIVKRPIKTLIITPLSILTQWESELLKFSKGLKIATYHGTKRNSDAMMEEIYESDVVLTTYNTIHSDLKNGNSEIFDQFERVVADEAHKLRNKKSAMHQAFESVFCDTAKKIFLTGTPICNSEQDLINLFTLLNRKPYDEKSTWKSFTKLEALQELEILKNKFVLVKTLEGTMPNTLPELSIHNTSITFDPESSQHKKYERACVADYATILQKISKLRLCVDDTKLIDEDESEVAKKVRIILEIISQTPIDEKIIIFSSWLKMLDILDKIIEEDTFMFHGKLSNVEKDFVLSEFKKADTARILLITIKSGSVGLNLNIANNCIIVEPYWHFSEESQAIKRLHRIGQTKAVKVHHIHVSNSIENWMTKLQEKKKKIADKILYGKGDFEEIELLETEKKDLFDRFVNMRIDEDESEGGAQN